MTNNLFLSWWWNQEQSKIFDDTYRHILKGKHILYIPRAMYPDRYDSCLEWISSIFPISQWYIITLLKIGESFDTSLIDNIDGIYLWGGNTFRLLHLLRTSGFDNILNYAITQNKPIYWGSAGAIILWHNINTAPDMNIIKLDCSQTLGFNCIWGYSIVCHYREKQSEDSEIMEYIQHYQNPVIALPEWVGCYFQDDIFCAWGNGNVSVFTIKEKKIIKSGQQILL